MLVWQQYQSDLSRVYPMYAVSIIQLNDISTAMNPIQLLPVTIRSQLVDINNACRVDGLRARKLVLYLADGAQFELNYPISFDVNLFDYLTLNFNVLAFEFVGERIEYGRIRKMLDYVQS